MPIKFACPKCKTVMTVADTMAGKKGKCKCGQPIQVPGTQAAAGKSAQKTSQKTASGSAQPPRAQPPKAQPPAAAIGGALDELTESDFGRTSPFENVYNPKKAAGDGKQLEKFQPEGERKKAANRGKLTGGLIFIAILNFLHALGLIAVVVLVFVAAAAMANVEGQAKILLLGSTVVAAVCGTMAAFLIAGGVGILMKQKFGWFITSVYYVVLMCDRIMNLVMVIVGGMEQMPFFSALIALVITFALMSYILGGNAQSVFQIKTSLPLILAVILGVAIGGGLAAAGYFAGKEDAPAAALLAPERSFPQDLTQLASLPRN